MTHTTETNALPMVRLLPQGFFHTPASYEELSAWVEKHPAGERIHLYTAITMYQNLICELHAQGRLIIGEGK